jgi:hypothetical protein
MYLRFKFGLLSVFVQYSILHFLKEDKFHCTLYSAVYSTVQYSLVL